MPDDVRTRAREESARPRTLRATVRRVPDWVGEVVLVGLVYFGYVVVRALVQGRTDAALRHGRRLLDVSPDLVNRADLALNALTVSHPTLGAVAALMYHVPHLYVTLAVLVWLWVRRRGRYGEARTVLLLVTLVALVFFWLYPVAPPRLALPDAVEPTATVGGVRFGYGGAQRGFVNDYAAFPSLHIAWACWCSWAVASTTPARWTAVVWAYPVAVWVVVTATANHYTVDAVAGAVLVAAAVPVVRRLRRNRDPAPA